MAAEYADFKTPSGVGIQEYRHEFILRPQTSSLITVATLCVSDDSEPARPECLQSSIVTMFSTLGTDQLSLNLNNHKPPSTPGVNNLPSCHMSKSPTPSPPYLHTERK